MIAWIIYNREAADYNRQYIQYYIEEGSKLDIEVKLILVEELEFGVKESRWFLAYRRQEVVSPDFVICRSIYPLLSKQLELMGIRVFNNSFVSEVCNDKAKTYQYLVKTGIKMVDSTFIRNQQVKEILSDIQKPTVIKAVDGHGGSQVFLVGGQAKEIVLEEGVKERVVNTEEIFRNIEEGLGSSDVVVQPLTGSRYQDMRVYVIGNEIVAAVLRTARDGFKSNFSLGGEVCIYHLSEKEKDIVHRIIDQFEFGLVGIDFIIGDEGELIFNEIEDVVGSRMLYQCSEINIVELYLKFIVNELSNE